MYSAVPSPPELRLGIPGFTWPDLFDPARLAELHARFLEHLAATAPDVAARFEAYRASAGAGLKPEAVSAVLVDTAAHVAGFVARLFGVENERTAHANTILTDSPIFRMKDQLVKRRAVKRGEVAFDPAVDDAARALLWNAGVGEFDDELQVARAVCAILDREAVLKKTPPGSEGEAKAQVAR